MPVALAALLAGMFVARAARSDTGAPAPSLRLSQVIEQVSQDASLRERLLQSLDSLPNAWGLIGQNQRERLRNFILDRNWSGVDHFPALTVRELRASVTLANVAAGNNPAITKKIDPPYVEIGPLSANESGAADWQAPAADRRETAATPVKDLGYGLTMGDPPHPELWKWHWQSVRAAYLFNRLALNRLLDKAHIFRVRLNGQQTDSPEGLIDLLDRSGFEVWIEDARYFANFGHLHFKGEDVMMPFWLNTRIPLPHTKQTLLTPVSHAEDEIRIRGPGGDNADVSFYFGIDGRAEFRTMDTLDQYWVGKNVAHTYRHDRAREVTRLLAEVLTTYADLKHKYPDLPFNGYYRLGVCQDAIAAIEYHMEGKTSLFPITHDRKYFSGSSEIDQLFLRIPDDRNNSQVSWTRVLGSLPAKNLDDIRISELRRNLELVAQAESERRDVRQWSWRGGAILLAICALAALLGLRKRKSPLSRAT